MVVYLQHEDATWSPRLIPRLIATPPSEVTSAVQSTSCQVSSLIKVPTWGKALSWFSDRQFQVILRLSEFGHVRGLPMLSDKSWAMMKRGPSRPGKGCGALRRLSVAVAFDYISSNLYLFINNTHVISPYEPPQGLTPAPSALDWPMIRTSCRY